MGLYSLQNHLSFQVICNQLGFNGATCRVINASVFDNGLIKPLFSQYSHIDCNGDEMLLEQCDVQVNLPF